MIEKTDVVHPSTAKGGGGGDAAAAIAAAEPAPPQAVDAALIEAWLRTRSLSRGLPPPTPDHGGFRVETGLPHEPRRYVFPSPGPRIRALAATLEDPRILIKLCASAETLAALLPAGWSVGATGYVMSREGSSDGPPPALPAGYRLEIETAGQVAAARILAADGSLAASGRAARYGGVFGYDQIVTDAAHRRQGLGRAVMKGLEAAGRRAGDLQLLVATEEGRALYATLGWSVRSLYSTGAWAGTAEV